MNDPIVDEIRQSRAAHAAWFNYDLDAIEQDINKSKRDSGLVFIDGVARQPMPISVTDDAKPLEASAAAKAT